MISRHLTHRRGTSTLTMVLFLMTLTSTGLMYYWFQRSRAMERQLAQWERYRASNGQAEMPQPGLVWGPLSIGILATSATQAVAGAPELLGSAQWTRTADVAEKARVEAAALRQKVEAAAKLAASMTTGGNEGGVLAALAGSAPTVTTPRGDAAASHAAGQIAPVSPPDTDVAARTMRTSAPALVDSLEPISTDQPSGTALATAPATATGIDGAWAAPGPAAEAAPLPTRLDDTIPDALEAAPTPAPRRTRIRSVYDLEAGEQAATRRATPSRQNSATVTSMAQTPRRNVAPRSEAANAVRTPAPSRPAVATR